MSILKSTKQALPSSTAGTITPLWNVLDQNFNVLYIYLISCPVGSIKGPFLHLKRTGRLHLLSGKVLIHWREEGMIGKKLFKLEPSPLGIEVIEIEAKTEYTIEALEDSVLLNLCNYPWSSIEPNA